MPVSSKYKCFFLFLTISLVYIITRIIIFKGFDGTDDLHYAMLASRMLKGTYSPFVEGDIFSGRVLLIAWQALVYRLAGISVFTTHATTMFAVLLSCYLTVFKLLRANNITLVLVSTALFYFNPVLTNATKGVFPDIYVVLAGISVVILFRQSLQQVQPKRNLLNGIYIGLIIAACLFFKETIIVFFVLIACLTFIYKSRQAVITCMGMMVTLAICGGLIALWYYHYTGDALFRLTQVQNSNYYNPCSYDILPASYIISRLTYGPWQEFIADGFYPVVFTAAFILYSFTRRNPLALFKDPYIKMFVILLLTGLYFPFSLKGYQPLCGDIRHFLFLLPFGVCACAGYITTDIEQGKTTKWLAVSVMMLGLCVLSTPDKWQWMLWCFFIVYFLLQKFIRNSIFIRQKLVVFALLLWLCMPYYLFYRNSNWFADMQQLNKQLTGNRYYFADHDNMAHWRLLHRFDDTVHCYNLDAAPFKIFQLYYEKPDSTNFQPGWFLVNTKYTEHSDGFIHSIDSLQHTNYFSRVLTKGDMRAMYIQQPPQLSLVKNIVANDVKVMR